MPFDLCTALVLSRSRQLILLCAGGAFVCNSYARIFGRQWIVEKTQSPLSDFTFLDKASERNPYRSRFGFDRMSSTQVHAGSASVCDRVKEPEEESSDNVLAPGALFQTPNSSPEVTQPQGEEVMGAALQLKWRSLIANETKARHKYQRWHEVMRRLEKDQKVLTGKCHSLMARQEALNTTSPAERRLETRVGGASPGNAAQSRAASAAGNAHNFASITPLRKMPDRRFDLVKGHRRCASAENVAQMLKVQGKPRRGAIAPLEASWLSAGSGSTAFSVGDNSAEHLRLSEASNVQLASSLPSISVLDTGDADTEPGGLATAAGSVQSSDTISEGLAVDSRDSGAESADSGKGRLKVSLKTTIKHAVTSAKGVDKAKKMFVNTLRKRKNQDPKPTEKPPSHTSEEAAMVPLSVVSDGWRGAVERYTPCFQTGLNPPPESV